MGEDFDPWNHLHSQWQFNNLNSVSNTQQPYTGQYYINSMVLPTYISPYNSASSAASLRFPETRAQPGASVFIPSLIPPCGPPELAGLQKRIPVFDQSGNRTSFIFSSSGAPSPNLEYSSPAHAMQCSKEANVSNEREDEEMHEDTAEIDALLYSDSDYGYDEEEVSTGHSPEVIEPVSSKVASSMLPTKKRRIDREEFDTSLSDTASSGVSSHPETPLDHKSKEDDDYEGYDAQSSCVKGGGCYKNISNKRLKRAKIQETVSILRRIIPCGKGKDAATILDEAIRYLRSLKLLAKSIGATPV